MKIEQKLVEIQTIHHSMFKCDEFNFCTKGFRYLVKFGRRSVVFLVASNRKPKHAESFCLRRRSDLWRLSRCDHHPNVPHAVFLNSPWGTGFDNFLTENFNATKLVYVWIEYE